MSDSKGFGDTIEKIAHSLKLNIVAEKIARVAGKEDCGCKKRKEVLNKQFPYKR